MTSPNGILFVSYHANGAAITADPYRLALWCHPRAPQAPAVGDWVVMPSGAVYSVTSRMWRPLPRPDEYGPDAIRCAVFVEPVNRPRRETGTSYAHDAHCNVKHRAGPYPCPPHCDDAQHITGRPCPSCGTHIPRA